jgi:glutamyl-tRNA synthetase/glutamyl-Q tRNA(Asp) synthetase
VLNALYVWNTAGALGCRVLLRIEDHDRLRCRPEYERGVLDDLDWLGFTPDVHPTAEFRRGASGGRQSDRHAIYEAAARRLVGAGLVFACRCSRRALANPAPGDAQNARAYPGTCRDLELPLTGAYGWRVRLEAQAVEFEDLLLGPQVQRPHRQCGDVLIRDRQGHWTYQFAAAVDDMDQGIDLVIRGIDLLESTGRQIQLAGALGRPVPPVYMHHPLIMKSPAQKLSKSDGDTGVRDLRAAGWSREQVLQEALARGARGR